jgi:hypothetical protein
MGGRCLPHEPVGRRHLAADGRDDALAALDVARPALRGRDAPQRLERRDLHPVVPCAARKGG